MSVYTSVSRDELRQFLQYYTIGELISFKGITEGMENTNYFVDTSKGRYVLTLYEAYNTKELPFFLGLMQHLSAYQVKTITPVIDKKGGLLNQLCNKPAAIIERLSGVALSKKEVTLEHCRLIGDALAHFHLAAQSYDHYRPNARSDNFSPNMTMPLLASMSATDQQFFQKELSFQESIHWNTLPSGITHSDLFCDNSLFDHTDNKVILSGIIDLYFSCHDAYIYDLSVVANAWCFDESKEEFRLDTDRWFALLSAYNKVRKLEEIEKKAWLPMLRSSALRFWIWRLHNILNPREGEMVLQKDPNEYKNKLQACLQDHAHITQAVMSL
jgi:homoserine kinase type II